MKNSGTVVGQVKRKTFIPFVCYIFVSLLLLPPVSMNSYGKFLGHYGGLSVNNVLRLFKEGNRRVLAIMQTAFFLNHWENMYAEAEIKRRELEFEIADLRRKVEDVKQLRQALALGNSVEWHYINAEIIVRSGSTLQDSIAIDVGSQQGVYRDAPVLGFANGKYGLIGKVQTVQRRQSTVISLANRYYQLGVTAMLQNSRFQGILNSNGRMYRLDFINRQALSTIQSGDLVVSVGARESLYPRGIPIGFVQQVEELEYKASLSLVIKPVVELSQVEYVAVLLEDGQIKDRELKNKNESGKANIRPPKNMRPSTNKRIVYEQIRQYERPGGGATVEDPINLGRTN